MPKILIKKKKNRGEQSEANRKNRGNEENKKHKLIIRRKTKRNNGNSGNQSPDDFMYYPEFEDPKFYEKIYSKKEFRKGFIPSMMNESMDEACGQKKFEAFPQQIFLRNYISQETPYNGMLIFHGTGVGKTCTAVGIAEGLKNQIQRMNRKILVILKKNLVDNFIKTIYDLSKENKKKRPDDFVQCTGNTYTLGPDYDTYTIEQKLKLIQSNIKQYYNFITYDRFANTIMKQYNWDGKPSSLTPQIEANIAKEYSNTVLIIDEVHNIKSEEGSELKKVPPILETIIRLGENNRLILLSATPMYDKPEEIIYLMNLLLQNDKRPPVRNEDIFHSNGVFKDGGREYLRRVAKGYVSYLRSENPITNPIRVIPAEAIVPNSEIDFEGMGRIREDEKLKFTKLVMCKMSDFQTNGYLEVFQQVKTGRNTRFTNFGETQNEFNEESEGNNSNTNENNGNQNGNNSNLTDKRLVTARSETLEREREKLGSRQKFIYAANMIYPMKNGKGIYLSSAGNGLGIEKGSGTGRGGLIKIERENVQTRKKREFYRYQEHAIFNKGTINEAPFLDEKHLARYSAKLATLLQNIRESKGIIFIYSRYIEAGVIPICLMLEQNGYERYDVGQQGSFLDYSYNKLGGGGKAKPRCYLCNKEYDSPEHKKNNPKFHEFHASKFILLKGESQQDDVKKIDASRAKEIINNPRNIYGHDVKIIVGTQVTGEGIDFHNIRQIHILEPWWNNSRIDQIIGRGLRYCSHADLPLEERNVEIFQYSIEVPEISNTAIKKSNMNRALYQQNRNRETIDEYIYRIAEEKERKIKEVEYELRSVSVDCLFYKNANYLPPSKKVPVISSRGHRLSLPIGDTPYSKACFYREKCEFKCAWEPEPGKKYPTNDDTYDLYFAEEDIRKMKEDVKRLYQWKIVYTIDDFKKYFTEKERKERRDSGLNKLEESNRRGKMDNFLIYKVLDDFVRHKESVYDSYGREGYIIYRGKYYIYQPKEVLDENIPIYYRERPLMYKPDKIDFEEDDLVVVTKKSEAVSMYTQAIYALIIEEYKKMHKTLVYWVRADEWGKYAYIILKMVLEQYDAPIIVDFMKDIFNQMRKKSGSNRNNKSANLIEQIIADYKKIEYIATASPTSNNIIEFKWENNKYVWNERTKEWEQVAMKVDKREKKQLADIYGYLSKNKKGEYQLKLVDKTQDIGSITLEKKKSKRTEITGRVCGTFQVDYLIQYLQKIGMEFTKEQIQASKFKNVLCNLIEFTLRKRDAMDNRSIWFVSDENKVPKKNVRKIEIVDG